MFELLDKDFKRDIVYVINNLKEKINLINGQIEIFNKEMIL